MKKVKRNPRLGDIIWIENKGESFETEIVFINQGILFCSPTTDDPSQQHYKNCVCLKIYPNGDKIFF